ncbi:hypothetical protein GQ42DRAFT_154342 [Ramicandelaber brevisporus]|nr:hypothetical protein GQ42DRAFT_154342 [Ramicandelaber brevisporus]
MLPGVGWKVGWEDIGHIAGMIPLPDYFRLNLDLTWHKLPISATFTLAIPEPVIQLSPNFAALLKCVEKLRFGKFCDFMKFPINGSDFAEGFAGVGESFAAFAKAGSKVIMCSSKGLFTSATNDASSRLINGVLVAWRTPYLATSSWIWQSRMDSFLRHGDAMIFDDCKSKSIRRGSRDWMTSRSSGVLFMPHVSFRTFGVAERAKSNSFNEK